MGENESGLGILQDLQLGPLTTHSVVQFAASCRVAEQAWLVF